MTEVARHDGLGGALRPTAGLQLLGEYQGSGFTEPRYLVRRGDGQVVQLSRLVYLVVTAIADGGRDADGVAARVTGELEREVTAENVRYLVASKLAPLGMVLAGEPGQNPAPNAGIPQQAPRVNLLLGLRIRGVLLRPRAASAVGGALAWLHHPALVAVVLAGFAAFEAWLFGVHGAIGPLLGVLRQPVLFVAVAGLTLASLLFHEFGHASACRYGGGRPGAIGFGLYLVWPSLYTDVTDAYRLGRAGRLRTDLGGVYFNAIFLLVMAGCYAATGQPVFLAAALFGNFEILQQLVPVVRMDGYFILADLAGLPDLFGLLIPIMASLLPGTAFRRARARGSGLRHGPRVMVTAWVLLAIPLLAAVTAYTLWNLPVMAATAARSFTGGLAATRAGFAAGHPAAGLAGLLTVVLLVVPAVGLAYLVARVTAYGATLVIRHAARLSPRMRVPAITAGLMAVAFLVTGLGLAGVLTPSLPQPHPVAEAPARPQPRPQSGRPTQPAPALTAPATGHAPRTAAPAAPRAVPGTRRPAGSTPAAGATSPAAEAAGPQSAVTPGASSTSASTAAQSRPIAAAVPPRSAPAPPRTTRPAPSGSSPAGSGPAPSPSCAVQLGVSLLTIGLLCP
jgi:putative peptide zinc metalloprotease protein